MKRVIKLWPFFLIVIIACLFFYPVFKGRIPFPGDILVNTNPYKTEQYLNYKPGSYPNKAQGPDIINEIYPWRYFAASQLKQGNIPFWNPHNFSGNPQMANFQTAVFYPFNFLYLVLPFNLSWTLIIMLQPILAGFFMYLFLKKGIELKTFPSLIGAVSFSFSSYMSVWMEYGNIGSTMLWLPLALLLVKYYYKKFSALNILGLSLALCLAILAGYIQGVFYIYLLCFAYYNYLVFTTPGSFGKHGKNFLFLVSLGLPLVITLFQILPTLQIFSQSTRGAYGLTQIEKNLAPVFSWLTIFFPDFFGNPVTRNYWIDGTYIERVMYAGTAISFFAFYSIVSHVKILERKFFLVVAAISLIMATNLPLVKYFYLIPIPVISTTIPTREFSIFIFSIIILGSIGIDNLLGGGRIWKKSTYLYLSFYILTGIVIITLTKIIPGMSQNLKISERNLILPSFLLGLTVISILLKNINKKIFMIMIIIIVAVDLFYFFNKITPFTPRELVYPQTPVISYLKNNAGINRFWGFGYSYISPNYQSVDGTYSPEGNDPLHIFTYGQLLASSGKGKLPQMLPRPDANIYPAFGKDDLKNNFYRQRMLDLLGVKYVLNQTASSNFDSDNFPTNIYKLIWQDSSWQIYQNLQAVSRYFVTGDYLVASAKEEALSDIYNPQIDLRKTIILQKNPEILIDKKVQGKVELLNYESNIISLKVNLSGNGLLFISDSYYPEWEVQVDNKTSEMLLADYSFRAVAVSKGEHIVKFFYNPKSFKVGVVGSILGILSLILIIYFVKKNEKKI